MIELDGVEYQVQSTADITSDIIDYINDYCKEHDVRNSQDDVIYIEKNRTNPLYMIVWGLSYLVAIIQRLVYNVGCAFDIAASSPRQLLNLADIAKVKRRDASYTIIPCLIYASEEDDCLITKNIVLSIRVGGQNIAFHPAYETTVEKGHVLNMPLIADVSGPFTIKGGWASQFDAAVEGLDHIVLADSVPGTEQETIASLRARIQQRRLNYTQIDAAKQAIQELVGVASCSIFFNYSVTDSAVIGDITIPPRKALVIIQGYNDNIAKEYYSHLLCESVPGPLDRTTQQDYVTHANQRIPVYFVSPRTLSITIKIIVANKLTEAVLKGMKDKVCELSLQLNIGASISTVQVLDLASQTPGLEAAILGCTLNDGLYQVVPEADQLIVLAPENILIELSNGEDAGDLDEEEV